MLIVLAIVAIVTVLAVEGLRSFAKSDLRATATRMAGSIRYLFDRASTTGKVHRLVLDFDTGKYWAEVSDDAFILAAGKETDESRKMEAEKIAKEEEAKREAAEKQAFFGSSIPSKYLPKPFIPKRAKFNVTVGKDDPNVAVVIAKGMSGMSGGLLGMAQMGKELGSLSAGLQSAILS